MSAFSFQPGGNRNTWLTIAVILVAGFLAWWVGPELPTRPFVPVAPSQASAQPSSARTQPTSPVSPNVAPASLSDLVSGSWDSTRFVQGLALAFSRTERAETRILALQKLWSKRASLSETQLRQFKQELDALVRDTSDAPAVVAAAIHALAGLLDFMREKNFIAVSVIAEEGELFVRYLRDPSLHLTIRDAAIRAVGDLKFDPAREPVENLLRDEANLNVPQLARSGCLTLLRLAGQEAFPTILPLLQRTADQAIFGTAAFALGQIGTADAMSALVQNAARFPDSAAPDAALVNMEGVILETLSRPADGRAVDAVLATEHLWKEGQRERYLPILQALLAESSPPVSRAACDRLIDLAGRLPLDQEKQILEQMLAVVGTKPELASYGAAMRRRISAVVLVPSAANLATVPAPTK